MSRPAATSETRDASASPAPSVEELVDLARRLQVACVAGGRTVAVAESCTGGLVTHVLTEVPGSSEYLLGGAVTYSDAAKHAMLGVPLDAMRAHGAVSAQVATAMAEGVRARFGSDVSAAVTGIAGPGGGTDAKPVGLTYVAVAGARGHDVRRFVWSGDRSANKRRSADALLRLLLDRVEEGSRT